MTHAEMQSRKLAYEHLIKCLSDYDPTISMQAIPFPKHRIKANEYPSFFNKARIEGTVLAFALLNNTYGSVGDSDLYSLLNAYLTNPAKREQINRLIRPSTE